VTGPYKVTVTISKLADSAVRRLAAVQNPVVRTGFATKAEAREYIEDEIGSFARDPENTVRGRGTNVVTLTRTHAGGVRQIVVERYVISEDRGSERKRSASRIRVKAHTRRAPR